MKKILILGATGKLGKVVLKEALSSGFQIVALVRNPEKLSTTDQNLKVIKGNVTEKEDLESALQGVSAVISTLGHGFRTPFPIQEKTLTQLIPLMEEKGIKRFITVTGAGLKVKGDPKSLIAEALNVLFPFIDPYRMSDAKKQQDLLEKSTLSWTVVRTPVHNDKKRDKLTHVGFTQPMPWQTVSRNAVAHFTLNCITESTYLKQSPIIY